MRACLLLLFAVLLAGCGQPRQQLNILIWAGYIDPKITADFERRYHCKVVFEYFDNDAVIIPKLAAGGRSVYDIVCMGNHMIPALVQQNLLAPLRRENLPNFQNLAPDFIGREFDPENRFSIPYQWGASGLFVRTASPDALDRSWSLIFDPAKQPGPFVLVDEMKTSLSGALKYLGRSVNSTNVSDVAAARDLLVRTKKRSLGFHAGLGSADRVFNGEAVAAVAWTGNLVQQLKENPGVVFFIPREGSGWGIDSLGIPAQAPHRDLAEQFLNHLMDAQTAAQTAAYLGSPTCNRAALEFISPEIRDNPMIYPPAEVLQRLELINDLGDMTRLHDEAWAQIKSK